MSVNLKLRTFGTENLIGLKTFRIFTDDKTHKFTKGVKTKMYRYEVFGDTFFIQAGGYITTQDMVQNLNSRCFDTAVLELQ